MYILGRYLLSTTWVLSIQFLESGPYLEAGPRGPAPRAVILLLYCRPASESLERPPLK